MRYCSALGRIYGNIANSYKLVSFIAAFVSKNLSFCPTHMSHVLFEITHIHDIYTRSEFLGMIPFTLLGVMQ